MEIFDKIGKTFSEAGQKTKDLADIGKLNNDITHNNHQIDVFFKEIGERYYAIHSEDAEEAFADKVTAIRELKAQNDACQDQIRTLKGLTKCPGCGAEVKNNSPFCPNCGLRLLPENVIVCPSCGKLLEDDMEFCQYCGARLYEQPDTQEASAMGEEAPPQRCCACGTLLDDDAVFCPNCGAKQENT